MLDIITRFVQPIIQIKRDEWRKAIPMFLYFSFTIATLYILKPIRSSTFLTSHGSENLRYAYIGEGAFLIFFTFAYIHLSGWFKRKRTFFSAATLFFISNVIGFWYLFHYHMAGWVPFLFYIWVAAYSITIVTQFWTLANDLFDPRQAKRLFGFILSGGSLGGVIGGLVTNQMAQRVGTENLLLLVAGMLVICLFLIYFAAAGETRPVPHPHKPSGKSSEITRLQDKSTWKLFLGSRYLLLIVALVMIAKLVSTLIDNQFNAMVENAILEKNARTAFFGGFMAWLNAISFVLQLIVASHVLRGIGVAMSLLLLPIGLGLGSVGALLFPSLAAAIAIKTYDGSMNYSISQLGKEILYIPIPSSVRYRVKPIIDMLGFRASKSVAGIFIIFVSSLLGIPDEKLGLIVLLAVPIWIVVVWSVRDEYKHAIKKLISSPEEADQLSTSAPEEFRDAVSSLNGEHISDKLKPFVSHRSSVARKIAGAGCFVAHEDLNEQARIRQMVQDMTAYEALGLKRIDLELLFRQEGFSGIGSFGPYLSEKLKTRRDSSIDLKTLLLNDEQRVLDKLTECLASSAEDIRNKRIAILILSVLATQGTVDILLNRLSLTDDRSLRFNLIRALNQIKAREKRQFAAWTVKKEILNEAKNYLSIQAVLREYKKKTPPSSAKVTYLETVLEALKAENLERIFRLLSLLYSSDIILVIYKRLSDFKSAESFKAHALELLENVVEPKLAKVIAPVLEEIETPAGENFEAILAGFFNEKDPWLLVSAMLLVSELKLERFYPGVHELSRSPFPFVREAALVLEQTKK